jgi:phosphoserine phosphatase RsbX
LAVATIHYLTMPREGERENGDAVFVSDRGPEGTLFAVIDALGHGRNAAVVARRAVETLNALSRETGVEGAVSALHEALRGTRGACAFVCLVTRETITACSVGNIELRSTGMRLPFVLTAGVLGIRLRPLRVLSTKRTGRARLAAYSDGISSRFHLEDLAAYSTSEACRAIFERHRRPHDDATVLFADLADLA